MKSKLSNRWVIAGVTLGLAATLFAVFALALSSGPASTITPPGGLGGTEFMGASAVSGMMGSSAMGNVGGAGTTTNTALAALVSSGEQGASINSKAKTITYGGHSVTLVALASPHGKPNMTWEIDGLVNPTVVLQPGATVVVVLANTDWGYMHGFELTTTPPPYPDMAMAGVADGFFLMPLPSRTTKDLATASYYTRSSSFTTTPGIYHYLCPVPGHAAAGMFGTLVVR